MSTAAPEEVQAPQSADDLAALCEEIDRVLALPKSVQDSICGDLGRLCERAGVDHGTDFRVDVLLKRLSDRRYDLGVDLDRMRAEEDPAPEDPTTLDASESEGEKAERDAEKLRILQEKWTERTHEIEGSLGIAMVDLVRAKAGAKSAQKQVDKLAEELDFRYSQGPPTELPKPVARQTEMFDDGEEGDDSDDEEPAQGVIEMTDESRRAAVPLKALGIKPGILKKLAEASIETIGDVAALTALNRKLETVPGIGTEKAEAVCEAIRVFDQEYAADAEVALAKYGG